MVVDGRNFRNNGATSNRRQSSAFRQHNLYWTPDNTQIKYVDIKASREPLNSDENCKRRSKEAEEAKHDRCSNFPMARYPIASTDRIDASNLWRMYYSKCMMNHEEIHVNSRTSKVYLHV